MKKYLFFLDIDGTLIQSNQQPNSTALPELINKLSDKGFLFGLNSNRAYEDVIGIYKQFGLNGPIVLENGVCYYKSLGSSEILLIKNAQPLTELAIEIINNFIHEENLDCEFECTDTVEIITSGKLIKIPLGIYLNKFRKYTGSIHIFKFGERAPEIAQKLAKYLQDKFDLKGLDLQVEIPESFGNIIFYPRSANKSSALEYLKSIYTEYAFAMIGDDPADSDTAKVLDHFFAVGNASEKVKQAAEYAATETHTKGVIEILERF